MSDAWEWELAEDVKISARIEMPHHIEAVWLGPRLVSRSAAGGKLADHIVQLPPPKTMPKPAEVYRATPASREAVLTFDPAPAKNVTLRVDGQVVAPARTPDAAVLDPPLSTRILAVPSNRRRIVAGSAAAIFLVGSIVAWPSISRALVARELRNKLMSAPAETELTMSATSADHSLEATFPSDFEPTVDEEGATIGLHRTKKLEMVALISMPRPDLDDPRELDRIMMADLVTHADKAKAKMSTTITRKETCHGEPEAIVSTATMTQPDGVEIKVVACTILKEGRGYFFSYFVPQVIADLEEPTLRAIIDATKISDPSHIISATVSNGGNGGGLTVKNDFGDIPPTSFNGSGSVAFSHRGTQVGATGTIRGTFQSAPGYPRGTTITPATTPRLPNMPGVNRPHPTPLPTVPRGQLRGDPSAPQEGLVHGVNKSADAERDRRMRDNRQKIPW